MKVTLIGKGKGWEDAPAEGETWGIHSLCLKRPVSMVWDMHNLEETEEQEEIIEYVNKDKVPYMTLKKHDNIPTSIEFPVEEMPLEYAKCSIDYMIWYAYYIGATEIEMFGIYLVREEEYYTQRPSVEYWIGYVRGKGVEVIINEPTTICKGRLYGYDYVSEEFQCQD